MQVHHLNCATMCVPGGVLMDGRTPSLRSVPLVCHCLLLETGDGLVLIDTGLGLGDVRAPEQRLGAFFRRTMHFPLRESETAVRQVEHLGFAAEDVRHIVLTHLDFDHAGGLDDFPRATVHMLAAEQAAAAAQSSWLERSRFRPQQWSSSQARWVTYAPAGEHWFGFECVRSLRGVPGDVLLVPLPGHTLGHAGVAVWHGDRWMLHCGDAYFFHEEMDPHSRHCPPGLRFYQTMMEQDRRLRLHNQERLRELAMKHSDQVSVFCAHDRVELEAMQHAPADITRAVQVHHHGPSVRHI